MTKNTANIIFKKLYALVDKSKDFKPEEKALTFKLLKEFEDLIGRKGAKVELNVFKWVKLYLDLHVEIKSPISKLGSVAKVLTSLQNLINNEEEEDP